MIPSGDEVWPAVDPADDVFREDYMLRVVNRGGRKER